MLRIQNLTKSFAGIPVLQDLNLTVRKGEIYALLGKNGSGKSTTIKILSNLLNADNGVIFFNDHPLNKQSMSEIGIVPQEISVYTNLTIKENLQFFGRIYGLFGRYLEKRIIELFDAFDLHQHDNKKVNELSGGWKRRINLAIAMIHHPSLLVLDEPTAGLDIEIRNELWTLIENLKKEEIAILLTTHLLEEAENLCTRIGILHHGKIAMEGTMDELKKLIPANKIIIVETLEPENLFNRLRQIGWQHRNYGKKLIILLPNDYSLNEILILLADIPISSITKRDVNLEHIYYEVLNNQ